MDPETEIQDSEQIEATEPVVTEADELAVIDAALAGDGEPAPVTADPEPEAVTEDSSAAEPEAPEAAPAEEPDAVAVEMAELGVTNEKSQKRFRELANKAAEADELRQYKPAAESWQQLEGFLSEAKATPEQFGAAVGILKLVNSDDPALLGQAYEALKLELTNLGKRLGREAPGYDPLAEERDLSERVEAGEIDRASAAELARLRREQSLHSERASKSQQEMRAQQEHEQWVNRGREDLNTLEAELQRLDPAYAQKREQLVPLLRPILADLHPSKWAAKFKDAYLAMPTPAPAPAPRAAAGVSHQPLRPVGAGNPGLAREPKTEMEAIELAIQMANAATR